MYPNEWQSVYRLLICYEESQAIPALVPVLGMLCQSLPETHITVLTTELDHSVQLDTPVQIESVQKWMDESTVTWIRQHSFDAAIILTAPFQSPYAMAYLCYLAGIPIRVGQSKEFGGSVLSSCITPPSEEVSPVEYYIHLLRSLGFSIDVETEPSKVLASSIIA